jgi:hypothetical protein
MSVIEPIKNKPEFRDEKTSMTKWKLLNDEEARQNWDNHLMKFADCSPYQTYGWGQYHQAIGWRPCYFVAENEPGRVEAMFLGLLRRYPLKTGLMWCAGGPVGKLETWNESLPQTVLQAVNLKRLYLRFRCDRERDARTVLFLNHHNWSRSIYTMTSGVSMELDLSADEAELGRRLSGKWRRNLKLAQQNDLVIERCEKPDIREIFDVYAEMEARKNLARQFSLERLENLFARAGSNLIFYRCEEAATGRLLSFRGCLAIGNRAGDYLAATTERGRELRASYATFWELIRRCRHEGVRFYDLGGIDPWANPGVYTFKKETGARQIEYIGEWDWASAQWLRLLGNWAIRQKQKIRRVETRLGSNKVNLHRQPDENLKSWPDSDLKTA